ncbi:hypothetical protein [uncultured Clostridium sp.]|uniref:hypothetical protein n=1 Tax=uncultured Clostridium sp. TaxID=59620 RepID=UPI0026173788|nr:hypothetical protein [uncultured Clostridium sp.]
MNYLLVLPNYRAIGFKEVEGAQDALNMYHEGRIDKNNEKSIYSEYDMFEEKSREDLSIIIGAEEGEGQIYDIDEIVEGVRNSEMLEEEKEEIIGQLISEKINFDIGQYGIENILSEMITY